MDSTHLQLLVSKIEQENDVIAKKSVLDTLGTPDQIQGRERQVEQLLRCLIQHRKGYLPTFISVSGKSGSGKSSTVRFVCENLKEISYCFVNLRKARTIFGAANLILSELGREPLKNSQGLGTVVDEIESVMEEILARDGKPLVLVLDEFDVLFYDKRGNASDFVYRLVLLEENLKKKGYLVCIIGITNNVLAHWDLDDRVRSRIGNSEIFFDPYNKQDILDILKDRAERSLSRVDSSVLEQCAELSSVEHGDARRAIDLLREAADAAALAGQELAVSHVDIAYAKLENDKVTGLLDNMSRHMRILIVGFALVAYLTDKPWQSTMSIFNQYKMIFPKLDNPPKQLHYTRIHDILNQLENMGMVVSRNVSRGRYGYSENHKLVVPPELLLHIMVPEWLETYAKYKQDYFNLMHDPQYDSGNGRAFRFMGLTNFHKLTGKLEILGPDKKS